MNSYKNKYKIQLIDIYRKMLLKIKINKKLLTLRNKSIQQLTILKSINNNK